jgi:hypothetical protein
MILSLNRLRALNDTESQYKIGTRNLNGLAKGTRYLNGLAQPKEWSGKMGDTKLIPSLNSYDT